MPPSPERHTPVESIVNARSRLSIAYNGAVAWAAERGVQHHAKELSESQHSEQFYAELGRVALDVANEPLPSPSSLQVPVVRRVGRGVVAGPIPEKNPLSAQADSHKRMAYKAAHGVIESKDVPEAFGGPEPKAERVFRPILTERAQTRKERRAEKRLVAQVKDLRQSRLDRKSAIGMLGSAGTYSPMRSGLRRASANRSSRRDYKKGLIDAFELAERKKAPKDTTVTIPPPILRETEKLEHSGVRALKRQNAEAERKAQRRTVRHGTMMTWLDGAAQRRRDKQDDARARITP